MNKFDVDKAVGYVNKIIDNIRCATCDRLQGSRLRYPCGHTACENCITYADECQICSPTSQRFQSEPKPDYALTSTVKHATDLLKATQDLFDGDAFQHKRISEQLKIEKELFPKCIQAPIKYENKRKSSNIFLINKENSYSSYFPGETVPISEEIKMKNYVQQWLNKNEGNLGRKPFADLNINTQQLTGSNNKLEKVNVFGKNVPINANRKRSHFKTTVNRDNSHLQGSRESVKWKCKSTAKKVKKEPSITFVGNSTKSKQKCENDESGIFMDNDPIVIDDSQESVIDKDKNAWLAVLKACGNEETSSTSLLNINQVVVEHDNNNQVNSDICQFKDSHITRVPFFKRSTLTETCSYCKKEVNSAKPVPLKSQSKPVKITIDNESFVTTITVFNNVQNNTLMNTSHNVSVQTDSCKTYPVNNEVHINNNEIPESGRDRISAGKDIPIGVSECSCDKQSIDLFADDRKVFGDIDENAEIIKHVVIEDTDSDSDLDASGPMSVKADVHRSCLDIEYGILSEVVNVEEHQIKPRRGPRGHTPTSTDSSEKENYNPNRIKKQFADKKKYTKK